RRKHAGVVRRHPPLEAIEPLPVAEHGQILIGNGAAALLHDRADLVALVLLGEAHSGAEYLRNGLIASVSREDEEDRRKQVLRAEQRDDLSPVGSLAVQLTGVVTIAAAAVVSARAGAGARARGESHQLGVDPTGHRSRAGTGGS